MFEWFKRLLRKEESIPNLWEQRAMEYPYNPHPNEIIVVGKLAQDEKFMKEFNKHKALVKANKVKEVLGEKKRGRPTKLKPIVKTNRKSS